MCVCTFSHVLLDCQKQLPLPFDGVTLVAAKAQIDPLSNGHCDHVAPILSAGAVV